MSLTQSDLKNIKNLFKTVLDEDETLARKVDISHLPSKNEFYNKMDEVVGELKVIREEQPILSHQLANHEDRIDKIEKKLNIKANI